MAGTHDIDALVRFFGQLLDSAWPHVQSAAALGKYESFVDDWLQANWEMLVERALPPGVYLEIYADGADCNDRSSRVLSPSAEATSEVMCVPKDGGAQLFSVVGSVYVNVPQHGLPVEELVSCEGKWYARKPPFNHALVLVGSDTFVFDINLVTFV